MFTVTVTNHNAPSRFGHTVMREPMLCIGCGARHKALYKPAPGRPGVQLFDGPTVCTCGTKLGAWTIMRSWSTGPTRHFELDPKLPERYRTRKEAAAAKKEKNL